MNNNPDLQNFLTENGIQLDPVGHSITNTGNLEPEENMICLLSHYGHLQITGPDTATFLQGQTTCDLNEVDDTHSQYGAYCNVKGRMLSSFLLARLNTEQYLLRMRRELVSTTQATLGKYIVFSKAEQSDNSDSVIALGLSGPKAKSTIQQLFPNALEERLNSSIANENIAIQLDDEGLMFECWIKTDQLADLWPILSEGMTLQGSRSWELLTIRQGLGEVTGTTTDLFLPQMLNYQATGAISFTKGCYTGQEVIARMHYKGKMKRQMYRITAEEPNLSPSDHLFNTQQEQSIGDIVNSVCLGNGKTEALAVITIKDIEKNSVVAGENRAPIEVLSLPYAISN